MLICGYNMREGGDKTRTGSFNVSLVQCALQLLAHAINCERMTDLIDSTSTRYRAVQTFG